MTKPDYCERLTSEAKPTPNQIHWVGNSEVFGAKPRTDAPKFAMPLVEETVLETAFSPLYASLRRLSQKAAVNTGSKFALRAALQENPATAGLNPGWAAIAFLPVIKAPVSALGLGVRVFKQHNEYLDALRLYAPEYAFAGVSEEFIEGEWWEANGFVVGGKVSFLPLVCQERRRQQEQRIAGYSLVTRFTDIAEELAYHSTQAVHALGLDDCPFCFEFCRSARTEEVKLIDAHARLGEDFRLLPLLNDPLSFAEELVEAALAGKQADTLVSQKQAG